MIKKLLNRKAFTLLETILAIAIIAAIALPLLSVFLQAVKTNQAAKGVLSANYISQDYIEKLDTLTYESALQNLPVREEKDGYYLSVKITPYGTASSMFSSACDYAHLVYYADGRMLAVMPDGKWQMFPTIPSSVSLNTSGGQYSFSADSVSLSGGTGSVYCALIIDAMAKPSGTECSVTLGASCKALRYCNEYDADDITVAGTGETYCNLIAGDTSLVHVRTYVYETAYDADPVATSEGYVSIGNW
jgi:prepilin-type N-terminal cleavage/methylation domain-containing protein